MSNTEYISLNENEVRAIELTIRDQNDVPFYPDSAFTSIKDINRDDVVVETNAMIVGNKISTLVSTTVTSTLGTYFIFWKIVKGTYVYYHKTTVTVREM